MHSNKMNMIRVHTVDNIKNYVLYIPKYYFKNNEITHELVENILNSSKKMLSEYVFVGNIVSIVITDEIKNPSFPFVYPKFKNYKFTPIKVFDI